MLGHGRIVLEFHRIGGAALGQRTQGGGIVEHFGQRHQGLDDAPRAAGDVVDATAS